MRVALLVFAAFLTAIGVVGMALSTKAIGVLPFYWWGVASCALAGASALYVGLESHALFGEADNEDE